MRELVADALPLFLPALLPALLLLLAPLGGRRARTVFASILLIAAVGFLADILLLDHSQPNTLEVPNVFPRGPEGEPHRWVLETVTAPAWHYHLWLAVALALPGLILWLRRGRPRHPPQPALFGTGVFLSYLFLRLGLEKTAAPETLVWATGGTPALLLILPFVGIYCGRLGHGFVRFLRQLLLMALLQRLALVALAYAATTRHLGTHLDTHVITDIFQGPFGERVLQDDVERWLHTTCIPQLTFWVVATVVAGVVLGVLPWWLGGRARAAGAPAAVAPPPRTR